MTTRRITRRRFLATSAAAVTATPFVRAYAPGESKDKVRVAVIGIANRGAANLAGVASEEIVALCDVDPDHAAKSRAGYANTPFYTDYRKMYDAVANKIDAVVVATPDHIHAHASLIGMGLGKHLYCEKPMAHSVEEVRLMRKAAASKKLVTQMGTQIHAGDNYRRVVEIVKSGILGDITRVQVWLSGHPDPGKKIPAPTNPLKFDTDLWLGPVPHEFFFAKHTEHGGAWPHWNWRYWWAFGGGKLADFGCHYMDLPFWALDLGLPSRVKASGTPIPGSDNTVPHTMRVDYHFEMTGRKPAVHLTWYHGVSGPEDGKKTFKGFGSGVLFEGTNGALVADYGKYQLLPDAFAKDAKIPQKSIAPSVGHHKEWLDAIRNDGQPLCHFAYASRLTETVLLGNVAYRAGQEITWDASTGKTNSSKADEFVKWHVRKGWELKV